MADSRSQNYAPLLSVDRTALQQASSPSRMISMPRYPMTYYKGLRAMRILLKTHIFLWFITADPK